jgi:hypothetical protein
MFSLSPIRPDPPRIQEQSDAAVNSEAIFGRALPKVAKLKRNVVSLGHHQAIYRKPDFPGTCPEIKPDVTASLVNN